MEFKEFNKKIQQQFAEMIKTGKLFISTVSGNEVWEVYLNSFKDENDLRFRDPNSSEHNCNHCHNFIKRYGNIVAINDDGNIESIFSNITDAEEYQDSVEKCAELLENLEIKDVFFETYNSLNSLPYERCNKQQSTYRLGIAQNHKQYTTEEANLYKKYDGSYIVQPEEIRQFNHFHVDLPKQFVDFTGKSIDEIKGHYRDKYSVFKRAMEEIPLDTLNLVKDLINQGSLLDGNAHIDVVEAMIKIWNDAHFTTKTISNWYWDITYNMSERIAKFKNTLIGVLCTELAEGEELNKACENWNKRVDPVNYHKATAPITQKQINDAQKFVEENSYEESFNRKLASLDDIKASEILHMNVGDGEIKSASIFDNVKSSGTGRYKKSKFKDVAEVPIDKFMKDILPSCTSVEVLLENRMESNLCVLTKAVDNDSKSIFKWDNNYSWTFNGNLAGKSQIKDAVKSRGGKTDADIRISLYFPNTIDDYDLHVTDSNGNHIYYNNVRKTHSSSGMLDLDAQGIDGHQPPKKRVENVVFINKSQLIDGDIDIWVDNYSRNGFHTPFDIEIDIEDEVTLLQSPKSGSNNITVGKININKGEFQIHPDSNMIVKDSKSISKEIWNLETNNFHKVNLACLSPNHWGDNKSGNLFYMFMLGNAKAQGQIRSFHNENLIPKLLKHKKVMEVLGATNMIDPKDYPNHLAGVGFNSTVRDEVIVRCKGNFNRVIKLKF